MVSPIRYTTYTFYYFKNDYLQPDPFLHAPRRGPLRDRSRTAHHLSIFRPQHHHLTVPGPRRLQRTHKRWAYLLALADLRSPSLASASSSRLVHRKTCQSPRLSPTMRSLPPTLPARPPGVRSRARQLSTHRAPHLAAWWRRCAPGCARRDPLESWVQRLAHATRRYNSLRGTRNGARDDRTRVSQDHGACSNERTSALPRWQDRCVRASCGRKTT